VFLHAAINILNFQAESSMLGARKMNHRFTDTAFTYYVPSDVSEKQIFLLVFKFRIHQNRKAHLKVDVQSEYISVSLSGLNGEN
jgi:hypothetical protein